MKVTYGSGNEKTKIEDVKFGTVFVYEEAVYIHAAISELFSADCCGSIHANTGTAISIPDGTLVTTYPDSELIVR